MASGPLPALFHGKESENAQNFMRSTEAYFLINRITDKATKVALFAALISAGSQADWWTNLDAQHKATWTTVKAAFEAKWPTIAVARKTMLEYQKELLALRLKEDEVGERITLAEVTTWSHIHFHNQLKTLVQDAGVVNAPVLIHPVRDALPQVLRDLTTSAPLDWNTFLNEIKDVNIDILQDQVKREKEKKEVERAQNVRITHLENRQSDPVEILHLQMQQTSLRPNISSTGPSTRPTTTAAPQMRTSFTNQALHRPLRYTTVNPSSGGQCTFRDPPTQEEPTDTGHAAYEEQLRQWVAKWGEGARCTERTPFPLTPGTAQICSGKCFRCGAHGHIGPACELPPDAQLPKSESIWRGLCTRILGTFNRGTAPQVNYMLDEAYITEIAEQGNGSGSLA
ncbi:hypothetical protein P692DRAFT_201724556 [Suillus brevipes Sb2]|nr:hypothetical protein P692DRAFT_201724556 [Suillus brevipes Sb2]